MSSGAEFTATDLGVTRFSHDMQAGRSVEPKREGTSTWFLTSAAGILALQRAPKTLCTLASTPAQGRGEDGGHAAAFSRETGFRPPAAGRMAGLPSSPSTTPGPSPAVGSTLEHGRARDILLAKDKVQKEQSILVPCSELYRVYPT